MHLARTTLAGSFFSLVVLVHLPSPCSGIRASGDEGPDEELLLGKQLFEHEWQPGDPRSHAGDGLGPLFNGRSCGSCHQLGGLGGAGTSEKNVETLSVQSRFGRLVGQRVGTGPALTEQESEVLTRIHPGLAKAPSVVLHLASTDPDYDLWRGTIESIVSLSGGMTRPAVPRGPRSVQLEAHELGTALSLKGVSLDITQRNATAIFGAGLIDSIPDEAIEAAAAVAHPEQPKVRGRIARLADGRIGRFGWKAQVASLDDFTRAACAMELGLEVPGHHQSGPVGAADYAAPGLDLSEQDVQSLVRFVRSLPAPARRPVASGKPDATIDRTVALASLIEFLRDPNPSYRRSAAHELERRGEEARDAIPALHESLDDRNAGVADAVGRALVAIDPMGGKRFFSQLGCAACHVPKLGNVEGIYSDLLLHDMGPRLADTGVYYGRAIPTSPGDQSAGSSRVARSGSDVESNSDSRPPSAQEWRTPPLWGCRDSAPYLHDGRAATLDAAITQHDGEAAASGAAFARLSAGERLLLVTYLKSLGGS
jgi:CxxC motif-containing protein (DUF1111 family)